MLRDIVLRMSDDLAERAAIHAALGEVSRLALVHDLLTSDRSPQELQRRHALPSNLLTHHLDVLEAAGLVVRGRSSGDGRRRYVHLISRRLDDLVPRPIAVERSVLFVCTQNSARSQLAAALWTELIGHPAVSAGTHPARAVHRGAVAAAERAGLDIANAIPAQLTPRLRRGRRTITVCDLAHEELPTDDEALHWSIADPVPEGTSAAFDRTVNELRTRIELLAAA
jgi:ArsR family transcriptional regulator, arsenate/arsenite/antimonite-responsive transcriptional repressor / arsenate reductase (thioredoxin)